MQVKEVMTHNPEVVRPEALLQEVAEKKSTLDVGILPVCDGDQLIGLLTDRDVTVRATAAGCDPTLIQVCDVMTTHLVYCFEDQDLSTAARMMERCQIRRLPILNREKRLVGIVSLGDVALHSGDQALAGEALQNVSEPAAPAR